MAPTNKKPQGRQTNNSLSSMTEHIVISPPTVAETNSPRKKKTTTSTKTAAEIFTETEEVLQIGMHKVLEYVKNHDDAWPFMDPVEEDIAPRYYSIIRRPMDLLKMEEKLDSGEYNTFSEFRNDFKLIVNNCRLYNGQNNEYTEMVNNLQVAFEKATKKYFDQNSSDEETSFDYLDIKHDAFHEKVLSEKIKSKKLLKLEMDLDEEEEDEVEQEEDLNDQESDKKKRKNGAGKKEMKENIVKNEKKDDSSKKKLKQEDRESISKKEEKESSFKKGKRSSSPIDVKSSSSKKYKKEDTLVKKDKIKADYDKIEAALKKKDKKKIIKEIKKKHKGKIKGKIKKDRGRPKGSFKHKKDKMVESEIEEVSDFDAEDLIPEDEPPPLPPDIKTKDKDKDKKHKKDEKKSSKKEKDKKSKSKDLIKESSKSLKKEKKYQHENELMSDGFSSNESILRDSHLTSPIKESSKTKSTKSSKKKSSKKHEKREKSQNDYSEDSFFEDDDQGELFLKKSPIPSHKKSHKKAEKEEMSAEKKSKDLEKRKPGRPKNKHTDEIIDEADEKSVMIKSEHKKDKKKKDKKDRNNLETKKLKKKKSVPEIEPQYSESEFSNHSFNYDLDDNSISGRPITPDIVDKYDLIKHRRRQKINNESKNNQVSNKPSSGHQSAINNSKKHNKESKASGTSSKQSSKHEHKKHSSGGQRDIEKSPEPTVDKEKNHTLQETIEKLKKKSKKNKKDSALLDEIFGVKPTKQLNDEKTVYKKIRETYGNDKSPPVSQHKKLTEVAAKQPKNISEYDFIDDLVSSPTARQISPERKITSPFTTPKKKEKKSGHSSKHAHAKGESHSHKSSKKQEKANMEALELETEQTLKDINKWLELTPHMSEFGSASSSPSRYIIDDLDAVPNRTDDFIRSIPIQQENQENRQNLNSQFDALKNEGKVGLQDHNGVNKQVKSQITGDPKIAKISATGKPEVKQRKMTKLLNYVPPRKREHQRTIDRLQPGKSKGNLINSMSGASKNSTEPNKLDPIATKVKEIKNSLIVETNESGPKLSLGTVIDAEGFGLVQQHNFQDDKPLNEEEEEKNDEFETVKSPNRSDEPVRWSDLAKKDEPSKKDSDAVVDEEKIKKVEEPKPNLSAWFKAFGIPKKPAQTSNPGKDTPNSNTTADSLSQALGVDSNLSNQPTMRQRKSSTGSTTSELSSVSQDPDSPRITIDESYTSSYRSPVQLPLVTSPKPDEFSPRPTASTYEINGPIKVGFYQDTTKCSPEKSPQEMANTTPQYSMAHRTPPSVTPTTSLRDSFSYYTSNETVVKPPTISSSLFDQYNKKPEATMNDSSDYSGSPNHPNSPYHNQPMSPYPNPNSPYSGQQHQPRSSSSVSQAFTTQSTPSLLSPSSSTGTSEGQKSPYHNITSQTAVNTQEHVSKPTSDQALPQQPTVEPPTYSSAPQYTLTNLTTASSSQKANQSEPSSVTAVTSSVSNVQQLNSPQYSSNISSSVELKSSTASIPSTQPAWPPQSLYGANIDKNLFPLSLTNTAMDLNHHTQSQQQSHVSNQQQPNQSNQTPSMYSQLSSYTGYPDSLSHKKTIADTGLALPPISNDPVPLVAKDQDALRKQHALNTPPVYDTSKMPLDYANSDRYKSLDAYNRSFNKALSSSKTQGQSENTFDQSSSTQHHQQQQQPHQHQSHGSNNVIPNVPKPYSDRSSQQQQPDPYSNLNRAHSYLSNTNPSTDTSKATVPQHSKSSLDTSLASQPINPYVNNYMQQHQQTSQSAGPPTDYTMSAAAQNPQNQRYELTRQTPAAHQQPPMDMNSAYKSSAYMRNFASMMAEMMPSAQGPYSAQTMAHQFAKNFHQVTTATLQQFLPGSSMTTTAYSKTSRDDEPSSRQSSSKGFPAQQQQQSQYLGSNTQSSSAYSKERELQLTSQQQQHMAAYQQKFSEAANMAQAQQQQQQQQQQQHHSIDAKQSKKSSSKSSKKSSKSVASSHTGTSQDLLLNPAMSQQTAYPNQQIPPHGFPAYPTGSSKSSSVVPNDSTSSSSNKSSVPPVPGSAFNFAPTPPLPIPGPGLYGETANYLDDFRGTATPYYPLAAAAGHRNPSDLSVADKANSAVSSTVSSPYHQFLSHPSARAGYPFMNPPPFVMDQQQWNLRQQDELRTQMMLASNPYSQSGYPRHLWG